MRYQLLLFIPLFFMVAYCSPSKKNKIDSTTVENVKGIDTLSVYNDVFNDLIINHLYNRYLGNDGEEALIAYLRKKIDSTTYQTRVDVLKAKVQLQDSLKEVLYLNEQIAVVSRNKLDFINYPDFAEIDSTRLFEAIAKKPPVDFLNLESNYVMIEPISKLESLTPKSNAVGKLAFSGLYLNKKQSYGVLYFSFVCGQKCGKGNVILIKKVNNKWSIEQNYLM